MHMKRIFAYLFSFAVAAASVSCSPSAEPDDSDKGDGAVPEGVLRITADKTEIMADGGECVTFKVMFGSEDVSTKNTMHIVKEFDGKTENLVNGVNVFSTTAPGTYKFSAYLYSGGEHVSENQVSVTAVEAQSQVSYVQKVIGEQFTSLGCPSCPGLGTALKKVQETMPGVLIPISFHMDFGGISDPMTIEATRAFYNYHGFQGLPYFNLNFHKAGGVNANASAIMEAIDGELKNNPTTCGVAVETVYDQTSRRLDIVAKITSGAAVRYKYHIFLVEDGITGYDQMGANLSYVHNNVVRKMIAPATSGMDINSREPFTPGVEVTAEKSVTLDEDWNAENMRVVVAALTTLDGGTTWTCSNANECKVGGSAGYALKGDGSGTEQAAFRKHVAVWEFTGAWCTNCPSGYSNMNFVISRNDAYKESVHIMAFHSDYSGEDKLALPDNLTDRIMMDYNVGEGFPSFMTELRTSGGLVDATAFRSSLELAFNEYPAHCGVAVSSELTDSKINVTAKVASGLSSSYRVAVFVVEDRVKYYQKDGTLTHDEYNHRHVVRKIVSSTYMGDALREIAAGSEASKSYEIDMDSSWDPDQTYIYALAINADGYINNMNFCKVGENADYDYLNE